MNFPLDATVHCADGLAGHSTTLIVDPATEKVTHITVRPADPPHTEYLVSVAGIKSSTADSIELDCTLNQLAEMAQFIEAEFIEVPSSYYAGDMAMGYGYTGPEMVVVEHELIPEGKIAVRKGMSIEAADGHIGAVDELMVDPAGGQITHLVLQKGHFWGEAHVTLPITEIDRVEEYTIFLKLNKADIEVMPVVQIRRHYSKKEINELDIVLLTFTFNAVDKAEQAQASLKTLAQQTGTEIRNTAIVIKEADSKIKSKETGDVDAKRGALFGAVTGGLIGLLGGPVGAVIGAAAGAATGSVAADRIDRGFSNTYLEQIEDHLKPGRSALVTLVEQTSVEKVIAALANLNGKVIQQKLTDDVVSQFTNNS
jgi:uncharacterized membrane protein/sporulation protein YlmC with PRC-barrel domain